MSNTNKIETERKYIIEIPNVKILEAMSGFTSSEITQIYITDPERTHRIRKRVYLGGGVEYTENTKKRISGMSSIENERAITEDEFDVLKERIEPNSRALAKRRVTFEFLNKVFEIDVYPEWQRLCILEVELEREDEKIVFPSFINVICEVTGRREYSNHSMAYNFPDEPKM